MSAGSRKRVSAISCWLRFVGLVVPRSQRATWLCRREAGLDCLRVLERRGELAGYAPSVLFAWFCRDAAASAVSLRCGAIDPGKWLRTPAFFLFAAWAFLSLIGAGSHGFAVTRSLLSAIAAHSGGAFPDRLIGYGFPIAFAFLTGVLTALGKHALASRAWSYVSFLLVKTVSLSAVLLALWIEGGAAFRACLPAGAPRVLVGGLILAIVFIAAFDWAVVWNLADQQHRCPVCLRRLVMPVRIGSWASVFEPVTTEWICEAGHGSLCVDEIERGQSDRWIEIEAPVPSLSILS